MIGKPTRAELERRIREHLQWHPGSDTVALVWQGYLTGIFEWGLISVGDHDALSKLLPRVGVKEVVEIFSGEPLTSERAAEIDRQINR